MVGGGNELLTKFGTEELGEMIRLPGRLLRTLELSGAARGGAMVAGKA
jgi:hypothetical protein